MSDKIASVLATLTVIAIVVLAIYGACALFGLNFWRVSGTCYFILTSIQLYKHFRDK
jgi:hypothetical protein